MEQKAPDKLHGIDARPLFLIRVPVLIVKHDETVIQALNAIIGNRHTMGIAAKVIEHILGLVDGIANKIQVSVFLKLQVILVLYLAVTVNSRFSS